ncbi:MAG: DNA-processing protein DprA [Treponema sp.]|jgi:DNA processing protein|nr:DNA-processing protein DprA [Treponema sp.]
MDSGRGLLDLIIRQIPGYSDACRIKLCKEFDREEKFTQLSREDVTRILGAPRRDLPWTMDALRMRAEKDARAARQRGIEWVSYAESAYPPLLRELYDPPVALFYRGVLPDPEKPLAAVVGTRRPSGYAMAQAYDIALELGRGGVPVVSGLALGIDAMAHRGNLAGGGKTLAVLGSGPDMVFPASNRGIARSILESGGALVSEYPPGTEPAKWRFPARNRIIAALARGVLIVEAPASSGALITARFALEQGRDLWVAAAGISSPRGEGTRALAEDGGRVIRRAGDIFAEWGIEISGENVDSILSDGSDLASSLARSLNIGL